MLRLQQKQQLLIRWLKNQPQKKKRRSLVADEQPQRRVKLLPLTLLQVKKLLNLGPGDAGPRLVQLKKLRQRRQLLTVQKKPLRKKRLKWIYIKF
jgi:hypothetical protein